MKRFFVWIIIFTFFNGFNWRLKWLKKDFKLENFLINDISYNDDECSSTGKLSVMNSIFRCGWLEKFGQPSCKIQASWKKLKGWIFKALDLKWIAFRFQRPIESLLVLLRRLHTAAIPQFDISKTIQQLSYVGYFDQKRNIVSFKLLKFLNFWRMERLRLLKLTPRNSEKRGRNEAFKLK